MDNRDVCIQLQECIFVAGIQTVTFIRHRKQEVRWGPEDSGRRRVPSDCFHDLTFYSEQIHIWVKECPPTELQLLASITDICFIVSSVRDSIRCCADLWLGPPGWWLRPSLLPQTGCYTKLAESMIVNRHLLDVSIQMTWLHVGVRTFIAIRSQPSHVARVKDWPLGSSHPWFSQRTWMSPTAAEDTNIY